MTAEHQRRTEERLSEIESDLEDIASGVSEINERDYSADLDPLDQRLGSIDENLSSLCSAFEESVSGFDCQP